MSTPRPDKIICVGRNYLKHAMELGGEVPKEPLYFLKPASVLAEISSENNSVRLPKDKGEVHHELELVLRIGVDRNHRFEFTHFTFGLDLTLRDLQSNLKKAGQPWEKAKVFKNSAIVGPWQRMTSMEELLNRPFELLVNNERRQIGVGHDMRWTPTALLSDVTSWFPVCDGDLLYTGTPEGVGPLNPGDKVRVQSQDFAYEFSC